MRENTIQKIRETKIIAIVRGMEEKFILPLAEALAAGGISLMEITFNQAKPETFEATMRNITAVNEKLGDKLTCGAGTVISPEQVVLADKAGAAFIVSPNVDVDVIRRTRELGLVSLPGAMTASECLSAHYAGADFIKLFPAADLGTGYLKAIRAPLSHLKFLAVGGINENNAQDFIKAGALGLGIGGNLVNKDWIAAGEFNKITDLAHILVKAVNQ
ncbi:MAG: bifunctional 4-hydroxy-2-oxoglutarate aldolase/2-dehydro-3-deoxy-phosphogluconate aldolase [Treponema sp.]|jgi:2-dehydro-3-deoxyphosphogluconate aldolase/(4S)-4-hydroxy-2-oxoglutarate aldolase|nr:bifunctional 4-hydroxy-2-oxoglutarate aldolase/2-dehydro-3-deoxy-phosphogluconate aldolase [Treponema sp.]